MTQVYLAPTYGAGWQGLDASGNPLNAGQLFTYLAGTTTPLTTYTTSSGNIANANPIVLNADGRPPSEIWFIANNAYKIVVEDSGGNVIETRDNLPGINDFSAIQNGSIFLLGNVSGTNTLTATGNPTVTSLTAGQLFTLTPPNTNTTAATLQVDSTSAKSIFSQGATLSGFEMQAGIPLQLEYDGTEFNILGGRGRYVESVVSAVNFPTSGQYGDLTSIVIPAGDWDVSFHLDAVANGATVQQIRAGIGVTAGNVTTGLIFGSNVLNGPGPTVSSDSVLTVANYRILANQTTTVYGKDLATYTVATPQGYARLSARKWS